MNTTEKTSGAGRLSEAEFSVVRTMAGTVIGPSLEYGLPGADDELIASRIVESAGARHREIIRWGIRRFIADGGPAIEGAATDDSAFASRLREFMGKHPEFAEHFLRLLARAYYQDPRVIASCGRELKPPFPGGRVLEPGDWSLLEPVRSRGPIFREVLK